MVVERGNEAAAELELREDVGGEGGGVVEYLR